MLVLLLANHARTLSATVLPVLVEHTIGTVHALQHVLQQHMATFTVILVLFVSRHAIIVLQLHIASIVSLDTTYLRGHVWQAAPLALMQTPAQQLVRVVTWLFVVAVPVSHVVSLVQMDTIMTADNVLLCVTVAHMAIRWQDYVRPACILVCSVSVPNSVQLVQFLTNYLPSNATPRVRLAITPTIQFAQHVSLDAISAPQTLCVCNAWTGILCLIITVCRSVRLVSTLDYKGWPILLYVLHAKLVVIRALLTCVWSARRICYCLMGFVWHNVQFSTTQPNPPATWVWFQLKTVTSVCLVLHSAVAVSTPHIVWHAQLHTYITINARPIVHNKPISPTILTVCPVWVLVHNAGVNLSVWAV